MQEKRIRVWVQRFTNRTNLVLQWFDPDDGKRKSKSAETDDPDEAETRRADHEARLNEGRYKHTARIGWERFRKAFEDEYLAGLRENTRTGYKATLDHFERLCNPQGVRGTNARTVSQFVAGLRRQKGKGEGNGLMGSTLSLHLQHLRTILRWAVEQGYLSACPTFPRVDVPDKVPQPVNQADVDRLLEAAADPPMRAFLACAWLAGLRLAEALTLRWERTPRFPYLDLERNRIVLPAEFVKGKRDQWVTLAKGLRAELEALPRREGDDRVFRFTNQAGEEMTPGGVGRRVIVLARRAGVKLTYRSLRRGFGCRFAGKVPAQVLQKLMRHANIKTTLDYYANVDAAAEAAILDEV